MRYLMILGLFLASAFAGAVEESRLAPGMVNPGHEEQPRWFKESFLDLHEDVAEAAKSGRRLMLYFYQDGCPYCTKLLRDNFGQKAIADKARRHFDVIAINIWGDREVTDLAGTATTEKAYARSLRVQFTPTLLMFDEKGEMALRLNGYVPPAKFEAALDFVGARLEKQQSFADYLTAPASKPTRGRLHQTPWLMKPPLRLADSLRREPKPLLVLFEQKECAACDELHTEAFPRPEVSELLRRFQVAQIDMASNATVQTPAGEALRARDWARSLGVFYTPTLVFFDAGGREVFRVDGYLRPFHLASALDYVAAGAYLTQPEFQRFIEARAAARRARGERVDLMQ
jgi:thioredoxin-related protein